MANVNDYFSVQKFIESIRVQDLSIAVGDKFVACGGLSRKDFIDMMWPEYDFVPFANNSKQARSCRPGFD